MAQTKLKTVDVVVVGAGVAGTLMAKMLAEVGLDVLCLERGRMVHSEQEFAMPFAHDELKYEKKRSDILQDLSRETLTFRNKLDELALPMREFGSFSLGEVVGGAGLHWGGQSYRFLPWDFETRSRTIARYGEKALPEGCTSQDWGITYEELEPYYDMFEHIYGVGGRAGNLEGELQPGGNPFEGPRSREFPNPPNKLPQQSKLFAEAVTKLGYQPYPCPTAAASQSYVNAYRQTMSECVHGGYCAGFGCAMGAKGAPGTTVLPALVKHANFELRTLCNVIKVNMDSDGKKATGVTYVDARGRECFQSANIVVLTSYAFNNTRLMLLSGIGKPYDPISKKGVIGKNYAYQTTGRVTLFFEDSSFNVFIGGGGLTTAIDEYNGDNFDHTGLGFIGGGFIDVGSGGRTPIRNTPVPPNTPRWGSEWKRAVTKYYANNFSINFHAGCQSYSDSYLDLDPNYKDTFGLPLLRMNFDWHENEKLMGEFLIEKAKTIAALLKPDHMTSWCASSTPYNITPYQTTHNTGGVIMGADPHCSAVNPFLQSWDAHNVFVVGGSAFPQNSAYGPTETIGALACWAADTIRDQYVKNPGPMA